MANDIRLVVVDLDGTVVGETNEIRPAVKQAMQAVTQKGVQVAIATGRMYRSAQRFYTDLASTLPILSYQGALIQDPATEQVHQHWTVPRQQVESLLDYFEQPLLRHQLSVHFYIDDQLYVREMSESTQSYIQRSIAKPIVVGDLRRTLDTEPTKILAICENPETVDSLLITLRSLYPTDQVYFTKSISTFFEATHPQVNKGMAVRYLAEELLGLQPSQVMTIGDNFNDVEMIEYAGVGVAMGNAPEAIQAIADWVAPTVEKDGAVAALEKFIL